MLKIMLTIACTDMGDCFIGIAFFYLNLLWLHMQEFTEQTSSPGNTFKSLYSTPAWIGERAYVHVLIREYLVCCSFTTHFSV